MTRRGVVVASAAGLAVLVGAAYWPTFLWLYERYTAADTYYSHGFLIPPVTAGLLWLRRRRIPRDPARGCRLGLAGVICALVIHAGSLLVGIHFVSGLSLILFLLGAVLYLWGWPALRATAFPLAFLLFMVPLPISMINTFNYPLKQWAAAGAVILLRLSDMPVLLEGFYIHLANATMRVENPCSGLRYMISLLALGTLVASLLPLTWGRRVGVVVGSIPIAFAANLVRVVALILVANTFGERAAAPESIVHDLTGVAVFAISLAGFLGLGRVLEWRRSAVVS